MQNMQSLLYEGCGDEHYGDESGGNIMSDEEMYEPSPEEGGIVMEIEPEMDHDDGEGNIVLYSDLKKLSEYSQKLNEICKNVEFEDWMVAQLTKASDYVSEVWHRLDAQSDYDSEDTWSGDL